MAQHAPEGNGIEMWRMLVKNHEPLYKSKSWVWRKHLTKPIFPAELTKSSEVSTNGNRKFESLRGSSKKQLAHVAPKELQRSIFMHADALDSYNKVRTYIYKAMFERAICGNDLTGQFGATSSTRPKDNPNGPAPMDIGAVKGKGQG